MKIKRTSGGSFRNIERFFKESKNKTFYSRLEEYGKAGVDALAAATPKDTGLTADSWEYSIEMNDQHATIDWYNTNEQDGWFNVAAGLQYGHGTRNGGWVQGQDYINPAMKPIFDAIEDGVWGKVQGS